MWKEPQHKDVPYSVIYNSADGQWVRCPVMGHGSVSETAHRWDVIWPRKRWVNVKKTQCGYNAGWGKKSGQKISMLCLSSQTSGSEGNVIL